MKKTTTIQRDTGEQPSLFGTTAVPISEVGFLVITVGPWVAMVWLYWPRS